MFPQILASVPFVAYMPFIMVIFICAFGITYAIVKKHFEHKQIMAAIEKGTPLSELRPVQQVKKVSDWMRRLTGGIALLLMGIGMAIIASASVVFDYPDRDAGFGLFIASVVFLAFGTASTIRGILLRKYDKALSSDKSALNANNGQ
jgi:cell division protein FtsW (lipid II flippase)